MVCYLFRAAIEARREAAAKKEVDLIEISEVAPAGGAAAKEMKLGCCSMQ